MQYELTSVVQAFVQESIQWTSQNKKLLLFDKMSESVMIILIFQLVGLLVG